MEKNFIPRRDTLTRGRKDEEMFFLKFEVNEIIPVRRNWLGEVAYYLLSLVSAGLFALFLIWNNKVWKKARYTRTAIEQATYIILITKHHEEIVVEKELVKDEGGLESTVITFRHVKYVYERGEFIIQRNNLCLRNSQVLSLIRGVQQKNLALMKKTFGKLE